MGSKGTPVIIASNNICPNSAIVAEVTDSQLSDLEAYAGSGFSFVDGVGDSLPLMFYPRYEAISGSPISLDEIVKYTHNLYLVDFDGESISPAYTPIGDLLSIVEGKLVRQKSIEILNPSVWDKPSGLSVKVSIDYDGKSTVSYNSPFGKILDIKCEAEKLPDSFLGSIVSDRTGLYIEPSSDILDSAYSELERRVFSMAVRQFDINTKKLLDEDFFDRNGKMAKNLFRRAGVSLDTNYLSCVYDVLWREELLDRMPAILDNMKLNLSEALYYKKDNLGFYHWDKVNKIRDTIAWHGDVPEEVSRKFGEVVVLGSQYSELLEDLKFKHSIARVRSIESEIESLHLKLEESKRDSVKVEAGLGEKKCEIADRRNSLLDSLGIKDVASFVDSVKPVEPDLLPPLPDPDEDMPF